MKEFLLVQYIKQAVFTQIVNEPRCEKTRFLQMQKQRRRSASW